MCDLLTPISAANCICDNPFSTRSFRSLSAKGLRILRFGFFKGSGEVLVDIPAP
jgi:hypothetical protein